MGRGYVSLGEKRLPSTNPSSSSTRFRLRWEMKRSAQSHSLFIPGGDGPAGLGHPKLSDLPSCTAPAFGVSFQYFFSPTSPGPVRKPQARTSFGLAYGRDTFTAGPSLNESFFQFCAAYGHNTGELQQQHLTARQDNPHLWPAFLVKSSFK